MIGGYLQKQSFQLGVHLTHQLLARVNVVPLQEVYTVKLNPVWGINYSGSGLLSVYFRAFKNDGKTFIHSSIKDLYLLFPDSGSNLGAQQISEIKNMVINCEANNHSLEYQNIHPAINEFTYSPAIDFDIKLPVIPDVSFIDVYAVTVMQNNVDLTLGANLYKQTLPYKFR